jgi:DNA-binding NarL/FixJ family response regulator
MDQKRLKETITVLLVDDHTLVRRGFRRLIEDEEDLSVVGEAADGETGVRLSLELKPRVVLMDYSLPGIDGLLAMKRIVSARIEIAVIMLTMHGDEARVREAQKAGARGFLEKNANDLDLVTSIRRVAKGEFVFPVDPPEKASRGSGSGRELSAREIEILQFIVAGKSNREIAVHLNLSVHTVGAHRARIMKRLGIHKAAELVAYAIRNGLTRAT